MRRQVQYVVKSLLSVGTETNSKRICEREGRAATREASKGRELDVDWRQGERRHITEDEASPPGMVGGIVRIIKGSVAQLGFYAAIDVVIFQCVTPYLDQQTIQRNRIGGSHAYLLRCRNVGLRKFTAQAVVVIEEVDRHQ